MTAVAVGLPTTRQRSTLLALAVVEARRFARHPLFLIGLPLAVWAMVADAQAGGPHALDFEVIPAFFVGVLGFVVAFRLTRSTHGAADVIDGAPVTVTMRTGALCLACVVPVLAGLAVVLVHWRLLGIYPGQDWMWGTYGTRDRVLVSAVLPLLSSAGGPLLGVAAGRWLRFPGAPALCVAALLFGSLVLTYPAMQTMDASTVLARVLHLLPPYTSWGANNNDKAIVSYTGSMPWYAVWVTTLAGLATLTALRYGSTGAARRTIGRTFIALSVIGLAALVLAVAGGNQRPMITHPDGSSRVATPFERTSQ